MEIHGDILKALCGDAKLRLNSASSVAHCEKSPKR